jgi:hypothetical protein
MNEVYGKTRSGLHQAAFPARATGAYDLAASLLAFASTLPAFAYALSPHAGFPAFLALQMAGLVVPGLFLLRRLQRNGEITVPALLLIVSFACGPLGGLGCACMSLARWRRPAAKRLRGWYEYIAGVVEQDRIVRLHEELTWNRLHSDPHAEVPRFRPIMHGGSVDDQQRVLGVIGRRYHPDFRIALRDALRNKNGFIRAQAAAVASRLSAEEKKSLWATGAWGTSEPTQAPENGELR